MLLDLIAFGYGNCSNKKVNNIFEKAVAIKKQLKRVLVIDINCECKTKCILVSVKFHRQELNEYHVFSDFQVFTSSQSQILETAWQTMTKKNPVKIRRYKNTSIKKYKMFCL